MRAMAILASVMLGFFTGAANAADDQQSTLDRVTERGTLEICSTGDYQPFTYKDPDTGEYEGIDIDMGKDLADALGVGVRIVPTSWPTLMEDFTAGKCDIAMGGISVKLDRQSQAYFSDPYLVGGKTAIARCGEVDKYQTVAQLNQPSVNAIVNPGGTNERFAKAHLGNANVILHQDNTSIHEQIAKGKADVMVTDAIEAVVQANRNEELCAIHPDDPFTYSEKAYLLPRGDDVWREWVDQWLHMTKKTGQFEKTYQRWVQ